MSSWAGEATAPFKATSSGVYMMEVWEYEEITRVDEKLLSKCFSMLTK
jgi:hypothetical protein